VTYRATQLHDRRGAGAFAHRGADAVDEVLHAAPSATATIGAAAGTLSPSLALSPGQQMLVVAAADRVEVFAERVDAHHPVMGRVS
jgi:hypothetical protein